MTMSKHKISQFLQFLEIPCVGRMILTIEDAICVFYLLRIVTHKTIFPLLKSMHLSLSL